MIVYDDDKLRFRMDIACDRCDRRLIQEWVKNSPIAAKDRFPRATSDGILCDFFLEKVLMPILNGRGNGWRINPTKEGATDGSRDRRDRSDLWEYMMATESVIDCLKVDYAAFRDVWTNVDRED